MKKTYKIDVDCANCANKMEDAAQKLLALGYQSVYDFGGVIDWPYELMKEG